MSWRNYRFRWRAWERLQDTLLGKTLLFSDNDGWSDAELVRGYRAQHHVESAFRQMKDRDCIAIRPQYHWTDHQKIETHVLCCVLALCCLLQRELSRRGEQFLGGLQQGLAWSARFLRCSRSWAGSAKSTSCVQRGRRAASPS